MSKRQIDNTIADIRTLLAQLDNAETEFDRADASYFIEMQIDYLESVHRIAPDVAMQMARNEPTAAPKRVRPVPANPSESQKRAPKFEREARNAEIVGRYLAGERVYDIAPDYGLNPTYVWGLLKRLVPDDQRGPNRPTQTALAI